MPPIVASSRHPMFPTHSHSPTKGGVAVGYLLGAPHTRSATGHGVSELLSWCASKKSNVSPLRCLMVGHSNACNMDHELIKYGNSCESRCRLGIANAFGHFSTTQGELGSFVRGLVKNCLMVVDSGYSPLSVFALDTLWQSIPQAVALPETTTNQLHPLNFTWKKKTMIYIYI